MGGVAPVAGVTPPCRLDRWINWSLFFHYLLAGHGAVGEGGFLDV